MTTEALYRCQDCQWEGPEVELMTPIEDVEQRVGPGEPMPAGECPECGALCHEIDADEYTEATEPRPGPWSVAPCQATLGRDTLIVDRGGFEIARIRDSEAWNPGATLIGQNRNDRVHARILAAAPSLMLKGRAICDELTRICAYTGTDWIGSDTRHAIEDFRKLLASLEAKP